MRIDIITLFPEIFKGVFEESIIKNACKKGYVDIKLYNLRDYTNDKHRKVDDRPFGGGAGMVLKPQPIFDAVNDLKSDGCKVILLSPQGKKMTQNSVSELSKYKHIILICGRYEGVDERIRKYLIDFEISVGDYVLTGGEIPAMVLVDSIVRLIPGVLGNEESVEHETFSNGYIEYPQYTRPVDFRDMKVPKILTSGNHKKIDDWRKKQSFKKTQKNRPEFLNEKEGVD